MKPIRVVFRSPNNQPEAITTEQDLDSLKKLLNGGYLETTAFLVGRDSFSLFCDEDGKYKNLLPNLYLPQDIIVGPIFVSKAGKNGDLVDLTDKQIDLIKKEIQIKSMWSIRGMS